MPWGSQKTKGAEGEAGQGCGGISAGPRSATGQAALSRRICFLIHTILENAGKTCLSPPTPNTTGWGGTVSQILNLIGVGKPYEKLIEGLDLFSIKLLTGASLCI